MRKPNLRIITVLLAVTLCVAALSFTAYADGRDYYAYEPPMETTEPTDPPEPPEPEATPEPPFTPEGNLSLIDDIPYQSKQFITVQSKSGNYFYIIIDRAAEEENVYFLNMVDEADLMALIEEPESEPEPAPAVCTCKEKCTVGHVDTSCPVCATNMSECAGKEKKPDPTPAPEVPELEPTEKKSVVNPAILIVLLLALGGGAAYYFLKVKGKAKPKTKGSTDLNDYDYGSEDDEEYEFEPYDPEDAGDSSEETDAKEE